MTNTQIFENKTALVTGGSRGIGAATAKVLAKEGATVVVHYGNNSQAAENVAAEIQADGGKAFTIKLDLADSKLDLDSFKDELSDLLTQHNGNNKLDIIVNNAGVADWTALSENNSVDFDRQFAVNVKAPLLLTSKLQSLLNSGGKIVNVSSLIAARGLATGSVYAATKGAVDGFTKTLAVELADRQITVNAVAPGPTATDMAEFLTSDPEVKATIAAKSPLNAVGDPEDVANVIAFLASKRARWVTGQTVLVDGGASILF